VYIEKLHGLHAIGIMHSQVGGRAPAYCTGLGKMLLAYIDPDLVRNYYIKTGLHRYSDATIQSVDALLVQLEKVKAQGYALDLGEHEVEVRCVAVPIFGMSGRVLSAISVSGPASRMATLENQTELIQRTQETAYTISTRLGYRSRK
jgi:DNA-binding IclR family transcriptional regulator